MVVLLWPFILEALGSFKNRPLPHAARPLKLQPHMTTHDHFTLPLQGQFWWLWAVCVQNSAISPRTLSSGGHLFWRGKTDFAQIELIFASRIWRLHPKTQLHSHLLQVTVLQRQKKEILVNFASKMGAHQQNSGLTCQDFWVL